MSDALDLAHMTDAQFDALYTQRIEPLFAAGEKERAGAVLTFRRRLLIGVSLAVGLGVGVYLMFRELGAGAIAGVFGLVAAYATE